MKNTFQNKKNSKFYFKYIIFKLQKIKDKEIMGFLILLEKKKEIKWGKESTKIHTIPIFLIISSLPQRQKSHQAILTVLL